MLQRALIAHGDVRFDSKLAWRSPALLGCWIAQWVRRFFRRLKPQPVSRYRRAEKEARRQRESAGER